MDALKLTALDSEDLQVISAHLQDAIINVDEMRYLAQDMRFVMLANRFHWSGVNNAKNIAPQRRRTGLDFARVLSVRRRDIGGLGKAVALDLLSVDFVADDAPSGRIVLTFAGGGEIELRVECIEARMRDLGPVWTAQSTPVHDLDDD